MAKITAEDVSKALCRLALHYRDPDVNPDTLPVLVEDYLEDLGGMEQELFKLAIPEARRSCRFFPKSCDILEASKRVVPTYRELPALPAWDTDAEGQYKRNIEGARKILAMVSQGKRMPQSRPRQDEDWLQ